MKSSFLEKVIQRLDRIDPGSLQNQFLRLAGEKGFLEAIFHALREGLVVVDAEGMVRFANRTSGELLGFDPARIEGAPLRRYLKGVDWDRILDLDPGAWARMANRQIEVTWPQKRVLDFYVVPLPGEEREEGAVLIFRDVTRERETEARTLESEKLNAITLLAAGVAHEIGNPLNSLTIHLQLLEREAKDPESADWQEIAELLSVSRREVERLDQIITQFLRALRPTPVELKPCALDQLLKETVEFMGPEIRDRNVLVELDLGEGLPTVVADPTQVKQAFYNIIKNAHEAMDQGGMLKIGARWDEDSVAISFADTGPGLTAEALGRMFEPYQSSKERGSGLGLMVVQRIVRDHGGRIEIDSQPGHGATFTVILPRDRHRVRLLKAPARAGRETAPGPEARTP